MKQLNQENINFELLLDYVEGLLDVPAQARIQAKIAEDEYYAGIIEGIQFYYEKYGADREQLEAYLADFQDRLASKAAESAKVRSLRPTRLLSIAASVAVLALVGWMAIGLLSDSSNPDGLVADALDTPYPNVYTLTKGVNEDSIRSKIGDLYVQGAYEEVVEVLPVFISKTDQIKVEDYFLLGISYLYMDPPDTGAALRALFKAKALNPSETLSQQVDWYLALANYKDGKQSVAKILFESIAQQPDHYRKMQAVELLKGLK